jgi:hypothetical protein
MNFVELPWLIVMARTQRRTISDSTISGRIRRMASHDHAVIVEDVQGQKQAEPESGAALRATTSPAVF